MRKVRVAAGCDCTGWFCIRELSAFLRPAVLGILLLFIASGPTVGAEPDAKNVLVVFSSYSQEHRDLDLLELSLRAHFPGPVNFSAAYLDYQRLEDKSYRESLADTFRHEYRKVMPDVLIISSLPAIQFIMQYRDKMFPGVPIVFYSVSADELEGLKMLPGMTGVTGTVGLRGTIDLALRLHPDTNAVAVVTDTPGSGERHWLAAAHSELLRHQDKVREIDVIGPPSTKMLEQIDALPPRTVVLFQLAPQSSIEPAIGAFDVLTAAARRAPTYSAWASLCLNYGCIGGAYPDDPKIHLLTAEITARVLNGERPENIPIVHDTYHEVRVDWRQLRRWHIPESALPPGSLILYRPPSLWESYRKYIIAVIVLIVAQALLIVGLLWQRARKRKAEAGLRESEKRFRVMTDTTPSLVWMCDAQGRVTYLNERRIAFTGRVPEAVYGDTWTAYVHPDDQRNVLDAFSQALNDRKPFSREYRLRRSDGVYRWMLDVASPRVDGDRSFAGFIGSAIDVTDQKVAQQALEKVSGQLIEAQEKERSRIARELHDDICQRLALLSMELERADRVSQQSPEAVKQNLEAIRSHCSEIAGDVQSLSHQLHSSKLEYLGAASAIRGFCDEFSRQHEVSIKFTENDVPRHLPKDISLCLFRVTQEALHNAVKYSGVSEYAVELTAMTDEIQLIVRDEGAGFDVEEARKTSGLGLVSMQERVHLVHGSLCVESELGAGTTVLAVIPLAPENQGRAEDTAVEETVNATGTV